MQLNSTSNPPNTKNAFSNNASLQPQLRNTTRNIFSRNVIDSPSPNPPPSNTSPNGSSNVNIFNNKPIILNQIVPNNSVSSVVSNGQTNSSLTNSAQFVQQSPLPYNPFNKQNNQTNTSNVFNRPQNNTSPLHNTANNANNQNLMVNNENNNVTSQNFGAIFKNASQTQSSNFSSNSTTQQTNIIFTQNNHQNQNTISFQSNIQGNQFTARTNNIQIINNPSLIQQNNRIEAAIENNKPQLRNNMAFAQQKELTNLINTLQIDPHHPQFNNIISPFNYYHAKLILYSQIDNINQASQKNKAMQKDELKVKVKDSKYKNEIIMMIKQMSTTAAEFDHLRTNMKELQARAHQMQLTLKQQLSAERQKTIEKFRWEKMGEAIIEELNSIQNYLSDVIRPLFTACQTNQQIQLYEPDSFSLQIAKSLHKKINNIEASINEFISQAKYYYEQLSRHHSQNFLEAIAIIRQLMTYFQALCIKFQELKECLDSEMRNQPKQSMKIIQNRVKLIKRNEICKVNQFLKAFSKTLTFNPFRNSNRLDERMKRQSGL